jgi:hypothetical protein
MRVHSGFVRTPEQVREEEYEEEEEEEEGEDSLVVGRGWGKMVTRR